MPTTSNYPANKTRESKSTGRLAYSHFIAAYDWELASLTCHKSMPQLKHKHLTYLAITALAFGIARLVMLLPQSAGRNDFAHYYVSSRALLEGENPYAVSLADRYQQFGFEFDERIPHATNPPPLLWLFAPLAALPPLAACLLWQFVQLAAMAAMLAMVWKLCRLRLRPEVMLAIAAAVVFSNPVYWHIYHSQVQMLLGAMIVGALALNLRGRHHAACTLIAAAGLIKLFPLVLLPWFLWQTDEPVGAKLRRAAWVSAGCLLMISVTGPQLWGEFLHRGLDVVTSNAVNRTFNFGLPSLLGNLTHAWYDFAPPESAGIASHRVGLLAGLGLIAAAYTVCLFGKQNRQQQFSLLTLAMLAGSATMWGHYLVMLVFPGVIAALSVRDTKTLLPKMVVGAALLMIGMAGTGTPPALAALPLLNVLLHYLPLLAVVTLGVVLSRSLLADVSLSRWERTVGLPLHDECRTRNFE